MAAGAVGGSTALLSHLVKAGTRIAVNTSPEPASNIVLSLAEDLGVAALIAFAVFHPVAAAVIAAALLAAGIAVVVFLWSDGVLLGVAAPVLPGREPGRAGVVGGAG